ncbi:AAA family ATPase [Lysobacter sp. HDW10]|uniref:ATP-dependent nuclease n=1 Tax=Lysobacter sp. HDW10 TaxID=2714936 RepID=UPI001F0DEEA3|nr:AAA family ATPase [Lysobacter sp. HDW10]
MLEALYLLKPAYGDIPEIENQYPRWLYAKDRRDGDIKENCFIEANFELDSEDIDSLINRFGKNPLLETTFTVSRSYANETHWDIDVNEEVLVEHLTRNLSATTLKAIKKPTSLTSLITSLVDLEEGGEVSASDVAEVAALTKSNDLADKNPVDFIYEVLWPRVPTFFRFTNYNTLPGRIDLHKLGGDDEKPGNSELQTARALVALAGTTPEQLSSDDYEDRRAELEAVSIDLTRQVFEYWKQNPDLEVSIDVDKVEKQHPHQNQGVTIAVRYLEVRLRDRRTNYSNNFSQRSSGFQWFFSFLTAFSEFEKKESTIVLLDEPALSLHGKAQADFLRFINERLAPSSQVVYTTHSPFMVEMGHLERVRVVEDKGPPQGSVVTDEVLANDPDSLFPLQAALGYDIAQSLFVGPNNLVVEGTSDYIYLTTLSRLCGASGLSKLDERWRILPSGGATNIPTFVSLVGPHLDITVVADSDTQGMQRVTNMIANKILDDQRLIQINQVTSSKSADMEDLFSDGDYLSLFNETFGTKYKLADLQAGDRITKRLEGKHGKFDHGSVAETLLRAHSARAFSKATMDNFAALFDKVNSTIKV